MKEKCGNCDYWMKTSLCPLEKIGQKPSCNYPGCIEFITKEDNIEIIERLQIGL